MTLPGSTSDRASDRGQPSRRAFVVASASFAAGLAGLACGEAGAADQVGSAGPPDAATLEAAERLLGLSFTPAEREQLLRTMGDHRAPLDAVRNAGPLPESLAPATVFRARPSAGPAAPITTTGSPSALPTSVPPPPDDDAALAFAPLRSLAVWLRDRQITSVRLTEIALERIARLGPTLTCVITVTADLARQQARQADAEIAAGRWRGPLHGVPYGLKDIIDTAGIRTTWGAEPWRERVPDRDAVVTRRLAEAGAVLVAKTAVGALAYGDIWFGGTCQSPWDPTKGSSGSSAGSAAGVAAGLFPFAIGTETLGSIVSPCERCGTAGLRPTFGRVARTGCMPLVWTMDKIGPICRSIADTMAVLAAIHGADPGDPSSVDLPLDGDPDASVAGLRLGYDPAWLRDGPAAPFANAALEAARALGCETVPTTVPAIDPSPALLTLYAEAAAAFDQLTRTDRDDELAWQADEAWPNTFRRTRFLPAVELIQADRLRRRMLDELDAWFGTVDAVLAPPFAGGLLVLTNATGHPCAIFRAGFRTDTEPTSMTVLGRLGDEGTCVRVAAAIERRLGAWERRPPVG